MSSLTPSCHLFNLGAAKRYTTIDAAVEIDDWKMAPKLIPAEGDTKDITTHMSSNDLQPFAKKLFSHLFNKWFLLQSRYFRLRSNSLSYTHRSAKVNYLSIQVSLVNKQPKRK